MTYEAYEKALDLHLQMEYISELECIFKNACSEGKFLAAISECEFGDAHNICVKHCRVLNHTPLPSDIQKRLLEVINEEYDKLKEEFKAL